MRKGFTIVELLIVVVVIAILAAITLVAYNGIREQSQASAIQSDISSLSRKIQLEGVKNQTYPATLAALGETLNSSYSYVYRVNNTSTPADYCLTGSVNGTLYSAWRDSGGARTGLCVGFNYAVNGSAESGLTDWATSTGASVALSTARSTDGASSVLVTQSGAGSDRYAHYNFAALEPGSYTVTANVYLAATGTTDYSRGLWVNSNTPNVTFTNTAYAATVGSWQTMSNTFNVTQSASSLTVRFYAVVGADLYVDNLRVVKN